MKALSRWLTVVLVAASALPVALACGGSSGGTTEGAGAATTSPSASSTTAPTSTSSPTPSPTSTSTPVTRDDGGIVTAADASAPASRKRGLAYGSNTPADLAALSAGIGWWYNWSPAPDDTLPAGFTSPDVEFVPMVWGGTFTVAQVEAQIPAGAKYLLAFNEPNFGAQSNLTPAQAAALWPQIEQIATDRNLQIVSPALNYCGGNCNETTPFAWLDAFFAACTGCRVDCIAAHWYSCTKGALQSYLSDYETKYTQPIWLTEFSCLDGSLAATDANEASYMSDAVALLEADPRVFRYSWFTGRSTGSPAISLLDTDAGALTALGSSYVTLPR